MTARYVVEIKQRRGKWAPQCESPSMPVAQEIFTHMQHMRRKLRIVRVNDAGRLVLMKYEPPAA